MSNFVCEVFYHVLLKYGHENAEMQKRKFDDVTLQYSMLEDSSAIILEKLGTRKCIENMGNTLNALP